MTLPLPRIAEVALAFATPRRLPKPTELGERVVVLDIAFAANGGGPRFEKTTLRFIEKLGGRLVAWVDHHDSAHHARFAADHRFVLATKAEHGACPEMIDAELVARFARPDTIVCHTDFDGLASAAKWLRRGIEPYPGCDADARAIDTCLGEPGPTAARIERALRATARSAELRAAVVRQLVAGGQDEALWVPIDSAGDGYAELEANAHRLAGRYRPLGPELVIVDCSDETAAYDKTLLLLLGQERATIAVVVHGDSVTFAARFDSGVDFLERFGLSGGMPTRVSVRRGRLPEALLALGVSAETAEVFRPR